MNWSESGKRRKGDQLFPYWTGFACLIPSHMQASMYMFLKNIWKAIKEVDPLCQASLACVADVRKGRGRELGRETSRAPRVSLAPKTPFPKTPFPFPFKRLPRRLSFSCSEFVSSFNIHSLLLFTSLSYQINQALHLIAACSAEYNWLYRLHSCLVPPLHWLMLLT